MNDLISRQEALEAIVNTVSKVDDNKTLKDKYDGAVFRQHEILDIIKNMPPAQRWIPVSERLPETHLGWLLVTLICKDGERKTDMRWYSDYAGFEDLEDETIIAWMPLPEPFKEVE